MTQQELDEHLKSGKRFVMFGDPVYYYPEENKTEPYKWYRDGIAQAEIAIQSCTEEEFENSWYKKVVDDAMWLSCERERLQIEVQDLQQRVKELEADLKQWRQNYLYAVDTFERVYNDYGYSWQTNYSREAEGIKDLAELAYHFLYGEEREPSASSIQLEKK